MKLFANKVYLKHLITFPLIVIVFSPILMQLVKDSPCSTKTPSKKHLLVNLLKDRQTHRHLSETRYFDFPLIPDLQHIFLRHEL